MLFYAFAMQCMSTLAIVKKETNSWKWPMIQLFGMSFWLMLLPFQLIKFLPNGMDSNFFVFSAALAAAFINFKWMPKKTKKESSAEQTVVVTKCCKSFNFPIFFYDLLLSNKKLYL